MLRLGAIDSPFKTFTDAKARRVHKTAIVDHHRMKRIPNRKSLSGPKIPRPGRRPEIVRLRDRQEILALAGRYALDLRTADRIRNHPEHRQDVPARDVTAKRHPEPFLQHRAHRRHPADEIDV